MGVSQVTMGLPKWSSFGGFGVALFCRKPPLATHIGACEASPGARTAVGAIHLAQGTRLTRGASRGDKMKAEVWSLGVLPRGSSKHHKTS